jgi:hypothetical protein
MHLKFIALFVAGAALSGCCVSGTGCYAPTPGVPIAWDGLGEAPTANGEQGGEVKPKRRTTARNREIILGPLNEAPPKETATKSNARSDYDAWTRLPNEDPEADAKLKRQLKICRDC